MANKKKPATEGTVTYTPFNDDKQLSGATEATIVKNNPDGSVNLEMAAVDGSIIQRHFVEAGAGFNQYK